MSSEEHWLARLLGRRNRRFIWQPLAFGPDFDWQDESHLILRSGPLAGESLEIAVLLNPVECRITLYHYGSVVGECHIERAGNRETAVLWDVGVKPDYRRRGLASLMTLVGFRRLLTVQRRASFRIRMVRLIKPGDTDIEFQNVGMGVIANRLGFTSELDIDRLLRPENVLKTDLLPPKGDFPPGLKIVIRTDPLVLVGFVLDSDTKRPVTDLGTYVRMLRSEDDLFDCVSRGLVVICNGDFRLSPGGFDRFLGCIARSQREAREFGAKLRGL